MFVALSKYLKPLEEVDTYRQQHKDYLKIFFDAGKLLVSGRQIPALGGVIISKDISHDEFTQILADDPFVKAGVAQYQVIEFSPGFYGY